MAIPPPFLHPFAKPSRTEFVRLVRGEGARLWDADGNEYVDAMASLWYCNAGHGRADIAAAVAEQLQTLAAYSCFDPFSNEPADGVAERVAELSPIERARVFLCCSGSEAVDTAIKLARLAQRLAGHPERQLVISRDQGYHGTNLGGTSAQGLAPNREGWGPLVPEIVQVPADDSEALGRLMNERSGEVAAVIAEPVQGAGGVRPPVPGYLEELRRLCDHHGAYLVFDEVITGFGRLGTWFGADHYGVTPDMITFAKGVSSGYQPLGGVVVAPVVHEPLAADPDYVLRHGYTYSGHAAACAAGLANLDVLDGEDLLAAASRVGTALGDGLRALAGDGTIAGARGVGAVWAAELSADHDAAAVREKMLADGVITRAIGDAVAFCPPFVITDDEITRILDSLAAAVS